MEPLLLSPHNTLDMPLSMLSCPAQKGCPHLCTRNSGIRERLSLSQSSGSSGLGSKREIDKLKWVQQGAFRMVRVLNTMSYEDRWKELGTFTLESRWLRGDIITIYKYLRGHNEKDRMDLFSFALEGRTRTNAFKLEESLPLNVRKNFLMVCTVRQWNIQP